MKLPRLAASAIGVAIVAASALAIAAPANAYTYDTTYVTAANIVTNSLGDGTAWISSDPGALDSSISGLFTPLGTEVAYLVSTPILASSGTAVVDFAQASYYYPSSDADASAGLIFVDADGWYFVYAEDSGSSSLNDPAALWTADDDLGYYLAGDTFTLAELDAMLADFDDPDISIGGLDLVALDDVEFYTASVDNIAFSFLPVPVSSSPATVTPAAFIANGVTVSSTGFVPGEQIEIEFRYLVNGQPVDEFDPVFIHADANGVASYVLRLPAGTTPSLGNSFVLFLGSSRSETFDFTVAAAVAALAATGTDSFAPLVAGGVLLLGGAALAIVAIRKRRTI